MWLFRTSLLVAALAALGACGFRPLYGTHGTVDAPAELALIKVEPIADRIGQTLHNHLLTALNPGGQASRPRYTLRTTVTESISSLAVRKTSFATRANMIVQAHFTVNRIADGKALYQSDSSITVSYNILESDFATLMAEKDARSRAVRELSEDIRTRLAVFLAREAKE